MKTRMQDIPWNFTEDQMAELYPELKPEDRAAAAYNLSGYFKVVARIYDRLEEEGKLEDVLLRAQWEKREQYKQHPNKPKPTDDTTTTHGASNEFTA